jgi:hypothetical protein
LPVLSFSELRLDVSDYEGQTSKDITNVLPRGDGYGPFAALAGFTSALSTACRGMFFARTNDGSIAIFAGTSTNLYVLSNSTLGWTLASVGGGPYTALPNNANWQFAQFNNYVFATQVNAVLQIYDLTSPGAFANAAGSPPQAAYVAVVNRFLVLSGLASPNVYRIQWSGLNDVSSSSAWTSGVNSSDFQDLPDGGIVRGVAGGEYGIIFQDASIRSMNFAPGSPTIFTIERISLDDGLFAPYSLVRSGDRVFYISPQGFKVITPGGAPTPIGKERVDRGYFSDVDASNLQLTIGANDPNATRVFFAYKSLAGSAGLFDRILCYDWMLDRWTRINQMGEYLGSLAKPGLTLEQIDAAYGDDGTAHTVTAFTTGTGSGDTFGLVGHGLTAGQGINFKTNGTLPNQYSVGTPYYVISAGLGSSTFRVSTSGGVGSLAGSAATSTSTGTGTIVYYVPSIDSLPRLSSFDIIATGTLPSFAGAGSDHSIGFFTGNNLEATLETPEHGNQGQRIFVRGARVVTDASSGSINLSVSGRETAQASATYSSETSPGVSGYCPQRVSTRFSRAKVRITANTTWTFAAGVEADVAPEGLR